MIDLINHLTPLREAQYNWDEPALLNILESLCTDETIFRLCHPFGEMIGAKAFHAEALSPLKSAWPDIERRDWLVMQGDDEHGHQWVGCGGHFMGSFMKAFLDIPPTGHLVHMRFHEFYRFVDGKIVEFQALWDIPEVMLQAQAWPLVPSLGREFCIPSPASSDGLNRPPREAKQSQASQQLIIDMLTHMKKHPAEGGAEVMEMPRFWHSKMNWYGPAGIGTGRGIAGFRNWHQIPFLAAMPDRGQKASEVTYHFFGDNNYVAVTGWPNMIQTLSHAGWLGLPPVGKEITMRSLDFWRIEDGLIRENWVMVDMLDMYRQLGIDVFARMQEFNKSRPSGTIAYEEAI